MVENKTIIAYASKSNATADNAEIIGNVLREKGIVVDIVDLRKTKNPDIDPYGNVIVGSGIRMGRWYGPVKKMLKRQELKDKQVFVYISCGTAIEPEKREEAISKYIKTMMNKVSLKPVSVDAFAGKMPGDNEDKRDPEKVRKWAHQILDKIA
jgi:menaquinone-dependent protoporphyrinogen oxidase